MFAQIVAIGHVSLDLLEAFFPVTAVCLEQKNVIKVPADTAAREHDRPNPIPIRCSPFGATSVAEQRHKRVGMTCHLVAHSYTVRPFRPSPRVSRFARVKHSWNWQEPLRYAENRSSVEQLEQTQS